MHDCTVTGSQAKHFQAIQQPKEVVIMNDGKMFKLCIVFKYFTEYASAPTPPKNTKDCSRMAGIVHTIEGKAQIE